MLQFARPQKPTSSRQFKTYEISKFNYGRQVINPSLWRMNSIEYDFCRSHLYMMCHNEIKCLPIPDLCLDKVINLKSLKLFDEGDVINQIQLNQNDASKEILVAVTMQGMVYIYDLSNTSLKPIVLSNIYQDIEDCSTWSLDIHCDEQNYLLAVGSNSKNISLWNIKNLDIFHINTQNKQSVQLNIPLKTTLEYRLFSDTCYDLLPSRYSITGHEHNIPCVKFSPCGNYLGSVDIAHLLILFTVTTGQLLIKYDMGNQGWAVEWIIKQDLTQAQYMMPYMQYMLAVGNTKEILLLDITKDRIIYLDKHREMNTNNNNRYSLLRYLPQMRILISVLQNNDHVEYFPIDINKKSTKFAFHRQIKSKFTGTHLQGICVRHILSKVLDYALVITLGYDGEILINKLQIEMKEDSLIDLSYCQL